MRLGTFPPPVFALALSPWLSVAIANNPDAGLDHASIIALPPADRRAAYLSADPATQARIWTERVDLYRNAHENELSPDQQGLLGRFAELAQHVNDMAEKEKADTFDRFGREAVAAFGMEDATLVFASLENLDGKGAGQQLENKSPKEGTHNGDADTKAVDCNCGGWPTCVKGVCLNSNCVYQPKGCGLWLEEPCTGTCLKAT